MRNWLTRGAIALGIFIVGGFAGWLLHSHGDDVAKISFYQDWRLACPADKDQKGACELAVDALDPKSGSKLAQITIARQSDKDDKRLMVVNVPLTVLIPAGLGIQFGSAAPQTFPYATCIASGCVAMIPVDDKIQTAMDAAPSMTLVVSTENGNPINIPVSVQGYGPASKTLKNNEAKRHSWWRRLWS